MKSLFRGALAAALILGSVLASEAHTTTYTAVLSGPLVSPANLSPGVGFATVTLDMDVITLEVDLSFSGLLGTVTAAHLHAATPTPFSGTAIVATAFTGFPVGVTSGTYHQNYDLTQASAYDPGFLAANSTGNPFTLVFDSLNALDFAIDGGKAYIDIHTTAFPGGEIRGFLVPTAPLSAPEPTPFVLMGLGGAASLALRRRRLPQELG